MNNIETLRKKSDFVGVVSETTPLTTNGAVWKGACPFCESPDFRVSPDKDIYFCFRCKKGGSIFNFVMETRGVTFGEAVKYLESRLNTQEARLF